MFVTFVMHHYINRNIYTLQDVIFPTYKDVNAALKLVYPLVHV